MGIGYRKPQGRLAPSLNFLFHSLKNKSTAICFESIDVTDDFRGQCDSDPLCFHV